MTFRRLVRSWCRQAIEFVTSTLKYVGRLKLQPNTSLQIRRFEFLNGKLQMSLQMSHLKAICGENEIDLCEDLGARFLISKKYEKVPHELNFNGQ